MRKAFAATATLVTLAAAGGVAAPPIASAGHPQGPRLQKSALQHGLNSFGGATMGWGSKRTIRSTSVSAPTALHRTSSTTGLTTAATTTTSSATPIGIDVAAYAGTVNWASFASQGVKFAFVKATEGTYYTSPTYTSQTSGATASGVLAGAYHFGNPAWSSGASQADYFIARGGAFKPGANQLPGVLDVEWNPYSGNSCYNLTQPQMYSWITSFQNEYHAKEGVYPIVYTARAWWNTCVGTGVNSAIIGARSPLWIAYYASTAGTMPSGYLSYTIWQNSAQSSYDTDVFQGGVNQLTALSIVGEAAH